MIRTFVKNAMRKTGFDIVRVKPETEFRSDHYLRHNARRLEHLASLNLPVAGQSVLEVGAGIGDHSHYYLDRGCRMTITDARPENLDVLRRRYPDADIQRLDADRPEPVRGAPFDVIHCYGLLYHLENPERAIAYLGESCRGLLFLETCVSFGDQELVNRVAEDHANPTQAVSGVGCRPTRPWILSRLRQAFQHAYVPTTQPNHAEFPLDWDHPEQHRAGLVRAVFIASKTPLNNPLLTTSLPRRQERHA